MPVTVEGLSGGIFWSTLLALAFFVIGYSTTGWYIVSDLRMGLWSACKDTGLPYANLDWMRATQVLSTAALMLLLLAFLIIFLYLFIPDVSINKSLLLRQYLLVAFLAVATIITALFVYANKMKASNLHWSYAFAAVGAVLCFLAATLTIVLMKKASNV